MRTWLPAGLLFAGFAALSAFAEIQVINGQQFECRDGMCVPVGAAATGGDLPEHGAVADGRAVRMVQGYVEPAAFVRWLQDGAEPSDLMSASRSGAFAVGLVLLLTLLGGLALNLTPCVLPMIPINLIVIGRSAQRGAAYGLGIAVAYGALGVAAAVGGLAFGTIQSNPWFNALVAVVFLALALSLLDVWFLDLSRFRTGASSVLTAGGRLPAWLVPLLMGLLSAVLAGACVAPILISVLLLTADWFGKGQVMALGLPFVLGLGMALPWPFLGAGLRVLPKPGAWMRSVNRVFAAIVLGFAVWYGRLAWQGFARSGASDVRPDAASLAMTPATFSLAGLQRPVLVDCWASWCKNCAAMDRVLSEPEVRKALEPFTVVRLRAEDLAELRRLPGFDGVRGLPAFVVFE
ncbi:MAG: cytochrome c biogenesis protein CcdA [Kiritimatiellia bacterium]